MEEKPQERPLVTFALFTYNQEKYIREAVEGAFAQTYEPLEIILSDDSSTDRTFEIIQEMVAEYKGRHQVAARQTERNRGTLLHVAEVASLAKGGLIVLGAGDDVAKPNRTSVLVEAWRSSGAWGLCSRFDRIDEAGILLETAVESRVLDGRGFRKFFYDDEGPVHIVHGCTSAYDAQAFNYLRLTDEDYILAEDGTMSVLLNLLGKRIVNLDDSLVKYRECSGSLTNERMRSRFSYARIVQDEERIERFAEAQANRCKLFLRMNEYLGAAQVRRMKTEAVKAEMRLQTIRTSWRKASLSERLNIALNNWRSTWVIPRMFGMRLFFASKWLVRRISGGKNG